MRFSFYLQHDSMKCGIAYLQMVCDFEPRRVSITFEGRDDVSLSFRIDRVSDSVITRDGEDYFSAFIPIKDWDAVRYRLASGMKVRATCTVSDRTV
ncbi:MAG: hypothetical protein LKK21_06230 [Prevotella sp.]|jgi:hypothetical protein|nr:hypothetical protein [Prevotella sp.]MCH3992678.1 hypothetical protein [Prevotella sp.]MCH4019149.1 hypothetical protein [Prevotella sp.]MCI1323616.1 hypothetical protein [Prevotella sp.]MCI1372281.1 hypothetical protein [Prevotella sp.]MCI2088303.1 hypothetical protein [Prevotella sp.]